MNEEWQPIESAPKDGTWIILGWTADVWDPDSGEGFAAQGQYHGDGNWMVEGALHNDPTHWLPLPEPPQ